VLGAIMFVLLRFIRGFCGFLYAFQILSLLPLFSWLDHPGEVTADMWTQSFIKAITLVLFGWLFFWLHGVINRLRIKMHGVPQPALAEKTIPAGEQTSNENFIISIWNGNAGLAMIYWVYGVPAGFVWVTAIGALQLVPGSGEAQILLTLMATHFVVLFIGIWRAASKCQGNKAWILLAKFTVVVGVFATVVPVAVGLFQVVVT
jgi:hypothetical protein